MAVPRVRFGGGSDDLPQKKKVQSRFKKILKNHIIYLGLALLGSRSGGSELADHVSMELLRKIDLA